MYFCLLFQNNYNRFPKTIDSTDFSASERSDIGLMYELCYFFKLNVKNPAFAQQKIAQMRRVFFEEL